MPLEDRKVQLANGKVLTLRAVEDEPPSIYVNNAIFDMTEWEINIDFSELRGAKPGETPDSAIALIKPRVRLIMTVPYAKIFSQALIRHLAKREQLEQQQQAEPVEGQLGEIPPSAS